MTAPRRTGRHRSGLDDPECLRTLLIRIHTAGTSAWRTDPEVAALMRHAADKYAALARRHGLDPWEAATAAFEAMRNPSTRRAEDPWAVVTHAVRVTCIAEERGQGLLCSTGRARRPAYSVFHDAQRFSDRDTDLTDYDPAFHHTDLQPDSEDTGSDIGRAIEETKLLLQLLGWPPNTAASIVDYLCARLTQSDSRAAAVHALLHDLHAQALFDLPADRWHHLVRALLGHPDPDRAHTRTGRGVILRQLVGEPLPALLSDDMLIAHLQPATARGGEDG